MSQVRRITASILAWSLAAVAAGTARADDWPQWRGPEQPTGAGSYCT